MYLFGWYCVLPKFPLQMQKANVLTFSVIMAAKIKWENTEKSTVIQGKTLRENFCSSEITLQRVKILFYSKKEPQI